MFPSLANLDAKLQNKNDICKKNAKKAPPKRCFPYPIHHAPYTNSPITAKVRYRSQAVEATLKNESCLVFATPVWGITPGQSVVLYQDDLVVGGGIII